MNAVEIEEAISRLAEQPFDRAEFPYAFIDEAVEKIKEGTITGYIYEPESVSLIRRGDGSLPSPG